MNRLAQIPIPPPVKGRITVVGVCGTGKSTLTTHLNALGYDAHECLQEHSFIQDMWRRISRPEVLIVLLASHQTVLRRNYDITPGEYAEECRKLANARAHAAIMVQTDSLDAANVARLVASILTIYRILKV